MIISSNLILVHTDNEVISQVGTTYKDLGGNFIRGPIGNYAGVIAALRPYVTSTKHNLLDEITPGRAFSGEDYYSCIAAFNTNESSVAENVRIWLTADSVSEDTSIQLGLGLSPIVNYSDATKNGTAIVEPLIANHFTAPESVVFQDAVGIANSILIGNLSPLQGRMFWVKRTTLPNAAQMIGDNFTLNIGTSQT